MTLLRPQAVSLLQEFERSGLRLHIGHVHHAGHTSRRSCTCLCVHIGLLGESRLAHVHMIIYYSRQQVEPRGIYHFIICGQFCIAQDVGYQTVLNNEGARKTFSLIHYRCVAYNHFLPLILPILSLITPKRASLKMPPLILLVPSSRLTNTTGTSLILNPRRRALYFISIWKA